MQAPCSERAAPSDAEGSDVDRRKEGRAVTTLEREADLESDPCIIWSVVSPSFARAASGS